MNNTILEMSWIRGNAESLPCNDNMFDVYTVAFGIRNMTHMDKVWEREIGYCELLKNPYHTGVIGSVSCLETGRKIYVPRIQSSYESYIQKVRIYYKYVPN